MTPLARLVMSALRRLRAPGHLAALGVLGLAAAVRLVDPEPVEELRLRGFDLEQRLAPRAYAAPQVPVRIVEIDEEALRRFGQWPWPRTLVAQLVERIAAAEPLALGIDIVFAEPDRYSPPRIAATLPDLPEPAAHILAGLPSSERALAEALGKVPTVLGVGLLSEGNAASGPVRLSLVRESGGDPRPFLERYPGLLHSLPEISAAEKGRGAMTGKPDPDGIVRRVPLMVATDNRLIPTLALELLRVAAGGAPLTIVTAPRGIESVRVGDVVVPTDLRGGTYPYFTPSLAERYVSAAAVLDGSVDAAALRDGIVLLGVTGLGLVDVKQTPTGLMQGIEVHAQLIESILLGTVLRRPLTMNGAEMAVLLLGGLLAIFLFPYDRPVLAGAAVLGLVGSYLLGEFALFRWLGLLADGAYPAFSSLAVFGTMLGANLRAAQAARRQLAADLARTREAKARLEGELSAARAIQMGLMPRRFPPFPERTDIDLHAFIEPARTIGGDLYDFVLIDRQRLFFAVADVSGKGIPAALFMAMTKEVLHAAVIRHAAALDAAMAEANAKVAAAGVDMLEEGADMMFVTVLAGILDLHTGECRTVSAGHDSPFLLRRGEAPQQVAASGGPPLGAVDDFIYPINRHVLRRGDTLFLFSDGVTEAQDASRALYGLPRLRQVLAGAPPGPAPDVIQSVRADLAAFVGAAEQADDITMLALRWLG